MHRLYSPACRAAADSCLLWSLLGPPARLPFRQDSTTHVVERSTHHLLGAQRPPDEKPPTSLHYISWPRPTWKTSLAHLRHRLCWQGRITTGLENISRQMGQMSCFSRLSMLCASPSSGLKPTVKFIPSAIVPTLALALVLAFSHCPWTLPRLLRTVWGFLCSLLLLTPEIALLSLLSLPLTIRLVLRWLFSDTSLSLVTLCPAPWPGTWSFSYPSLPEWLGPWKFLLLFPKRLLVTLWAALFVSHSPERRLILTWGWGTRGICGTFQFPI